MKLLLTQLHKDKHKLYSLHAPKVECIAKGKAGEYHEFGIKASITTTHNEGLLVTIKSVPSNPHDKYTLPSAVQQIYVLTIPKAVFVDRDYRGIEVHSLRIWRSGQKRGMMPSSKK